MAGIPYNTARGAASTLQQAPPFAFSDVTMSVFPLRASLPRLEAFCRNYLNQAPDIVQFRPFLPFVYLVILDYGRMSMEAANMGWVSQREVAFGVPLRWLNAGPKGLEFHDWAFTSPFIFVDNELSMSTGREVYGWPKLLARLDPTVSQWVREPHGSRRVFQVSTKSATHAYEGQLREFRPFLSVNQSQASGVFDVPPTLDNIARPMAHAPEAFAGMARLARDLGSTLSGLAMSGVTRSGVAPNLLSIDVVREGIEQGDWKRFLDPDKWGPGLQTLFWALFPRLYANTINLKQFRDAGDPVATCYQAVTAARMPIRSLRHGGFLGPEAMMTGRIDGGFTIDVHHMAGLPIVDSLGLEVDEERQDGEATVSALSPVCPFWVKVDMTYGLADTVVWRGRRGRWRPGPAMPDHLEPSREGPSGRRPNAMHAPPVPTERRMSGEQPPPLEPEPDATMQAELDRAEGAAAGSDAVPKVSRPLFDPFSDEDDEGEDWRDQDAYAPGPADAPGLDYIEAMNFFNTARGASEALGGGFEMPHAAVRVLPIKAEPAVLRKFVRSYLDVAGRNRFEPWGDFVYLTLTDFARMKSELNDIADSHVREILLAVPVKCYEWYNDGEHPDDADPEPDPEDREAVERRRGERFRRGARKLVTTGFVSAFSYVDDIGAAITDSEVAGVPTLRSEIVSPQNDWLTLDHSAAMAERSLLTMYSLVLPALMVGAGARQRRVLEVHTHTPPMQSATEAGHISPSRWVRLLAEDLEQKTGQVQPFQVRPPGNEEEDARPLYPSGGGVDARAEFRPSACGAGLALQLLTGRLPFNEFSLKQFRDAKVATDACYQALVLGRRRITALKDLREIHEPIHVAIMDYPTQPIGEILGLIPKFSYPGKDRIVRVYEAMRPFTMRADLRREPGMTLYERVRGASWHDVDQPEHLFGWRRFSAAQIREIGPCETAEIKYRCRVRTEGGGFVRMRRPATRLTRDFFDAHFGDVEKEAALEDIFLRERMGLEATKHGVTNDVSLLKPISQGRIRDLESYSFELAATGREERLPPFQLAGAMEFVDPATIMDLTLSNQWGLAGGKGWRRFRRNLFCVPATTVDQALAERLFPKPERLDGTWPLTERAHMHRTRRRTSEIQQFITEFWAMIDVCCVPEMIAGDDAADLDAREGESESQAATRRYERLENSRVYRMARENIPRSFWDSPIKRIFEREELSPYQHRSSEEWAALEEGLERTRCELQRLLGYDYDKSMDGMFDAWDELARQNREEMGAIEQTGFHPETYELKEPHKVLRQRLAEALSDGLLPGEEEHHVP